MSEETLADRIKAIRMAARDNLSEAGKKVLFCLKSQP